jgi:hypothetical protein
MFWRIFENCQLTPRLFIYFWNTRDPTIIELTEDEFVLE